MVVVVAADIPNAHHTIGEVLKYNIQCTKKKLRRPPTIRNRHKPIYEKNVGERIKYFLVELFVTKQ